MPTDSKHRRRGTLAVSWGESGGFYVTRSRVCLGRVAITLLDVEIEDLMQAYATATDDSWQEFLRVRRDYRARLKRKGRAT